MRRKRLPLGNACRVQHLDGRDFFCFLHLGELVLLRQPPKNRFLDGSLAVQIGVTHAQQGQLSYGGVKKIILGWIYRSRRSFIARDYPQLILQLSDSCLQRAYSHVAIRIYLPQPFQFGARSDKVALQNGC